MSYNFPLFLPVLESKDQVSDKQKWKQMQNLMGDSVKFIDMLHDVDWENGIDPNLLANVEYYLPKQSPTGEGGVTGEGSLLDVPGKLIRLYFVSSRVPHILGERR